MTTMSVMPPPKKPGRSGGGSKKPNRNGVPINFWIPDDLHAALQAFRSAQRVKPSQTDVVELALQEFLQREGFWPPNSR
jgi:hypothetical protein